MIRRAAEALKAGGFGRYALLNLSAVLLVLAITPYVSREGAGLAEELRETSAPRAPNLIEKRVANAEKRKAPTPEVLASAPATSLPTVPLSAATKNAIVELVSAPEVETVPLAVALDTAESLPQEPLRPLHKPRYRGLYADLRKHEAARRTATATASAQPSQARSNARAARARKRDVLASTAGPDLSPGDIALRQFSHSYALLTP